ncbi:hypothetical protein JCM17961_27180 [Endothiovibrio diazotrophicus]
MPLAKSAPSNGGAMVAGSGGSGSPSGISRGAVALPAASRTVRLRVSPEAAAIARVKAPSSSAVAVACWSPLVTVTAAPASTLPAGALRV